MKPQGQPVFRVKASAEDVPVFIAAYPNTDYHPKTATSSARGTVMIVAEDRMFYEPIVLKFPAGDSLWALRELLGLSLFTSKREARKLLGPALRKIAKGGVMPRLLPDSVSPRGVSGKRPAAGRRGTLVSVLDPWSKTPATMSPGKLFTTYSRSPWVTDPNQFARRRR